MERQWRKNARRGQSELTALTPCRVWAPLARTQVVPGGLNKPQEYAAAIEKLAESDPLAKRLTQRCVGFAWPVKAAALPLSAGGYGRSRVKSGGWARSHHNGR
jgi:hypothetical protein